ncbi:MAG: ArsC family reductase [Spirosomaceae bacterium]|nr:ArsC family reductase [Spirosomataceae bacterium]
MLTLYGIPNCNTVKKARTWLQENNVAYEFHDYKKQGIDAEKIENWMTQQPWEKLVNRAGMTYRKLSDQEKAAINDNASATKLMIEKTSVIKRPIVEKDGNIVALGFKEDEYQTLFS